MQHGQAQPVGRSRRLIIADGTAGLHDGRYAGLGRPFDAVGKREVCV